MKWIYLLLSLLLGIICAGCAQDRLTIVVRSVQSDVAIEAQYEIYQSQRERKQAD